jgi:hypothetical protein
MTLDDALLSVWKQVLVDRYGVAEIDGVKYLAKRTPSSRLWQVDFTFEGRNLCGLEQNPKTKSRWAELARAGKKVMQFLEGGRYIAAVADGKVILYGKHGSED